METLGCYSDVVSGDVRLAGDTCMCWAAVCVRGLAAMDGDVVCAAWRRCVVMQCGGVEWSRAAAIVCVCAQPGGDGVKAAVCCDGDCVC